MSSFYNTDETIEQLAERVLLYKNRVEALEWGIDKACELISCGLAQKGLDTLRAVRGPSDTTNKGAPS